MSIWQLQLGCTNKNLHSYQFAWEATPLIDHPSILKSFILLNFHPHYASKETIFLCPPTDWFITQNAKKRFLVFWGTHLGRLSSVYHISLWLNDCRHNHSAMQLLAPLCEGHSVPHWEQPDPIWALIHPESSVVRWFKSEEICKSSLGC